MLRRKQKKGEKRIQIVKHQLIMIFSQARNKKRAKKYVPPKSE
jgi:hypothetical protein